MENDVRGWPYRLGRAVVTVAVGTIVGWFFTDATWRVLAHPFDRPGATPAAFLPQLKLAFIFGFVLMSPIWLHQLLKIAPRGNGRHPVLLGAAVLLFGGGCALAFLSLNEGLWLASGYGTVMLITDTEYLDEALARVLILGLLAVAPLLAIVIRRHLSRRDPAT